MPNDQNNIKTKSNRKICSNLTALRPLFEKLNTKRKQNSKYKKVLCMKYQNMEY